MNKQMIKRISLLIAILLLFSAAGCSLRPKRSADEPFRLGFRDSLQNLNPYGAVGAPETAALSLLYDTLFVLDSETGKIEPGLCVGHSITQNKDGSYSWDLEIRSGVHWHDGRALTAKDVMFTLKTTQLFSALYGSPNCDFFYGGNMTVVDDTHLSFVVWDDYAYMEEYLSEIPILPEHIWNELSYMRYTEASQAADHPAAVQQLPLEEANSATMIGSGPWRWGDCKNGVCRLYRNEDYWNGAPELEVVELVSGITDPKEALLSGSVDAVWDMSPTDMAEAAELGYMTGSGAAGVMLSLQFNLHENSRSLMDDPVLRQSLNACLDRETILVQAFEGGMTNQTVMTPGCFWCYDTATQDVDPGWLLEQHGYTDRDGDGIREAADGSTMVLNLLYPEESSRWSAAAELISRQCAEIGIAIEIHPVTTEDMHRRMASGEYDMVLTGWNAGTDPAFLFGTFYWGGGENAFCVLNEKNQLSFPGWNDTGYKNTEYDALYNRLIQTEDTVHRKEIVTELGSILQRDLPALVLGWPVQNQACLSQWMEFGNGRDGLLFTAMSLRKILSTVHF